MTSATGNFHATASFANGEVPAGNWGGYGGNCGCPSTSCAVSPFPTHGYTTTVDIYLDVDAGWDNGTRFDYSSAINQPNGSHRRDFIFNAGFYNAGDASAPGSGSDRYIISASNNSSPGQNPANGVDPIAITSTGWYTFEHRFYRTPGDVLAVDLTIYDPSGASVGSWTRSNPTDIIGVTVGDNRYGWFPVNQFNDLAFDNATRFTGGAAELVLDAADCQDDADPAPGYQIAVELRMENLTSLVSGFQAFVEYPMGTLMYRGDLSSYTNSPFPNHILAINQADDGRLELDGTDTFGNTGTLDDSLLATLIFDVVPTCTPTVPATFELGGSFGSELSFLGTPLVTALNDAPAITLDDTAPMLVDVPANITQPSDAGACSGAIVSWIDPTATDDCDASPVIQCSPASGSFFAVGTTTVVCTATDACGNVSMSTFDVTVTDTVLVDVTVTIEGSAATTRCIRFVPDDCGSAASFELTFLADGLNATATDTIELPCGLWTQLCGKDEQHTFWDTVPLMLSGTNYATMTPLFLRSGDTDNDGDVDINDVTFFVAQFGGFAVDGGCPFDGTSRDSDFSNSGTVQIEDYAALVTNWLTTSDCACSALASGEADTRRTTESWIPVRDGHSARADLDQNGRVDWRDVALFEQRHGLSGELSRKMRD
ncbi:MAG: HYR domain-containing protein [Planctomycetota bacterium]